LEPLAREADLCGRLLVPLVRSSTVGSLQGFHSCWSLGLERAARGDISTVTDDLFVNV